MIVETVRLSRRAKEQLVKLKRATGIEHWNVLCRWALCVSLADKTVPATFSMLEMSNIEMAWRTFGGARAEIYDMLVRERCKLDGCAQDGESLATAFRNHLHRGIASLSSGKEVSSIGELLARVTEAESSQRMTAGR